MRLGDEITWQEALRIKSPVTFLCMGSRYLMVDEARIILSWPELIVQGDQAHVHRIVAHRGAEDIRVVSFAEVPSPLHE